MLHLGVQKRVPIFKKGVTLFNKGGTLSEDMRPSRPPKGSAPLQLRFNELVPMPRFKGFPHLERNSLQDPWWAKAVQHQDQQAWAKDSEWQPEEA